MAHKKGNKKRKCPLCARESLNNAISKQFLLAWLKATIDGKN
jgi:hypothetical protein